MTEYSGGFISSVIERSDQIVRKDRYDVTRLLLLMNIGFGMVWERLKYHVDPDEEYVSDTASDNKFEKKLGKSRCETYLRMGEQKFFENFSHNEQWHLIQIRGYRRRYKIKDILMELSSEHILPRSNLKYSSLMKCLRNSFAHGGIHPLSPQQSRAYKMDNLNAVSLGFGSPEIIDKVFFVSKSLDVNNKPIGFNILVMSVEALHLFWQDWRELLFKNEIFHYVDLDNAA